MSELAACLAVFQRFAAATVPGRRIERYIFYSCLRPSVKGWSHFLSEMTNPGRYPPS